MSGFIIREAVLENAAQIGAVHYKAWLETYTGMLPEPFLSARSAEKSTEIFYKAGCADTVVAEIDGKIVGFCGWGKFREDVFEKDMGEIYGIYLLSAYQRNHLGRRMLEYALNRLKATGYQKAGLWVLEDNLAAIAFYEKSGFQDSGTKKEVGFGQSVTELLYVKGL